jgi:hypothetical protein
MPNADQRAKELHDELFRTSNKHRLLANLYRNCSMLLMAAAVASAAASAIAGFKFGSAAWAGGLSLVGPSLAVIATGLKLDPRASWYRKKEQALAGLRRRLRYEMPEYPDADQIALISRERTSLEQKLQKDFEKTCLYRWEPFLAGRKR